MPDRENGGEWEERVDFWATALLVPLFAYWVPTQFSTSEALAWASTGALLEISGLVRTAWSLDEKLSEAKKIPRFAERVRRRLLRRLRSGWRRLRSALGRDRRGEAQSIGAPVARVEATAGSVGVSKSPAKESTLEVRVEQLEKQISLLRRRIGEVHTDAHQKAVELEERIREVRNDLLEADRRQKDLLERVTVGGFEWEVLGLCWFLLGVVAATWGAALPLL